MSIAYNKYKHIRPSCGARITKKKKMEGRKDRIKQMLNKEKGFFFFLWNVIQGWDWNRYNYLHTVFERGFLLEHNSWC